MNAKLSTLSLAIGSVFAVSLIAAPVAKAAGNPFGMQQLNSGYLVADAKAADGKCGDKKDHDGKCGDKKAADGKCGDKKAKDGKCGEGKCGAKKDGKAADGKCGDKKDHEGKCGDKKAHDADKK